MTKIWAKLNNEWGKLSFEEQVRSQVQLGNEGRDQDQEQDHEHEHEHEERPRIDTDFTDNDSKIAKSLIR